MVICLERGADLHMAQLMPLLLTVTCFRNTDWFTFLIPAHPGSRGQRAVCVYFMLDVRSASVCRLVFPFAHSDSAYSVMNTGSFLFSACRVRK